MRWALAPHRPLLAGDLGDARADRARQWNARFAVVHASGIAEIGNRALGFEAIAGVFVILIALNPQVLAALRAGNWRKDGRADHQRGRASHHAAERAKRRFCRRRKVVVHLASPYWIAP